MRFYPKPLTREEARNFIRVVLSQYRKWDFGWWALVLKHSGTFVGYTGLTLQEVDGVEELELGYMVRREYWGQGIATEAARACSEYAFDTKSWAPSLISATPIAVGSAEPLRTQSDWSDDTCLRKQTSQRSQKETSTRSNNA